MSRPDELSWPYTLQWIGRSGQTRLRAYHHQHERDEAERLLREMLKPDALATLRRGGPDVAPLFAEEAPHA
jgi:hypothetical protein